MVSGSGRGSGTFKDFEGCGERMYLAPFVADAQSTLRVIIMRQVGGERAGRQVSKMNGRNWKSMQHR